MTSLSGRSARPRLLVWGVLAALLAAEALAQSRPRRRTAGGRDFPSWEGDVDSSVPEPLPVAPTGEYSIAVSVAIGGVATGVATLSDGTLAAVRDDGHVVFLSAAGRRAGEVAGPSAATWPPVALGRAVLAADDAELAAVSPAGLAWTVSLPSPLSSRPVHAGPGLWLARADGVVALLDPVSGEPRWETDVGARPTTSVSWRPGLVVVGLDGGEVIGLGDEDGNERWRLGVADAVDAVTVTTRSVFAAGTGLAGRSRWSRGPLAMRIALGADGRPAAPRPRWRLRVGGATRTPPVLLGPLVAFPTWAGYVHAVEREKGRQGWRTDLPARALHPPVRSGGRLDFVLARTGWVVGLAAQNGAVMGYFELVDDDEIFVGPAARSGGLTFGATSLERVVGLSFAAEQRRRDDDR